MSARVKHEYIRATPIWQNQGSRYDCALINGQEGHGFAQVLGFFLVFHPSGDHRVALVNKYRCIGRHKSSDYLQLVQGTSFDFILVDTIIRAIHITSPSLYNKHFTVHDLQSPDIYIRLLDSPVE